MTTAAVEAPEPAGAPGSRLTLRRRPRALKVLGVLALVALVTGIAIRYVTHPAALPTSERRVDASTIAGSPVFIGVFDVPSDFGRTLDLSGVRVFATATTEVAITPHVCRSGAIGATREPEPFCDRLTGTEGVRLDPGDQIVLEVLGEGAGAVAIEPVRLAYAEGWQRAVQPAGSRALVTFLD